MSKIFFALLKRETKRYLRDRKRLLASLILPIIWLIIFGSGFGLSFRYGFSDISYEQYILPGIVGMTVLFSSMWSGASLIRDEQSGISKIIKTSPVADYTIVASKSSASALISVLQVVLLLILYSVFVSRVELFSVGYVLIISAILSFGFSSFGILIASVVETQESYDVAVNIFVLPLLFLSGALFPIEKSIVWMQYISNANPLTYGVDLMRQVLLGMSNFSLFYDIGVISISAILLFFVSVLALRKK